MQEDLEKLAVEAASIDGQATPAPASAEQTEGQAVAVDPAAEARDVIRFGVALFVPLYPSLVHVYNEGAQERLAQVTAPLLAKYGLTLGGIFERWGPEINFLIVAGPLAMETAKAIRHDNAARRGQQEAPEKPEQETADPARPE